MRRFYAEPEQFQGEDVILSFDETRHLRDVLRLRAGRVRVFNGKGGEFLAEIEKIEKTSASLKVLEQLPPASPESNLELTLAAAILKGEKFDLIIQKAVELGVTRFVPLETARCEVKLKDSPKRTERWRKIALEASKQSGRATLMEISEPIEFAGFLRSEHVRSPENVLLFTERDGIQFPNFDAAKIITAVVGPEGGWEDLEIMAARDAGFTLITLGGRIMRAETAAISVTAILQHRFGDLC